MLLLVEAQPKVEQNRCRYPGYPRIDAEQSPVATGSTAKAKPQTCSAGLEAASGPAPRGAFCFGPLTSTAGVGDQAGG
jgi:hypothetical protein